MLDGTQVQVPPIFLGLAKLINREKSEIENPYQRQRGLDKMQVRLEIIGKNGAFCSYSHINQHTMTMNIIKDNLDKAMGPLATIIGFFYSYLFPLILSYCYSIGSLFTVKKHH